MPLAGVATEGTKMPLAGVALALGMTNFCQLDGQRIMHGLCMGSCMGCRRLMGRAWAINVLSSPLGSLFPALHSFFAQHVTLWLRSYTFGFTVNDGELLPCFGVGLKRPTLTYIEVSDTSVPHSKGYPRVL